MRLVSDSVTALSAIQESILHVVEKVTEIAGNTVDQATGITEINTAVGALEKDVQNNAATLAQTSAAGQGLREEAGALVDLVRQFRLPTDGVMRTSRIAAE
ncbi:hypothetical protein [Rhodovulum steppense]|uniref:hypothetical protein n=1 Tax=Rhodovulum steppense TaxID=540251 RepID=UPI001404E156|nr:hypothetical protein [Rhodovulum steppense]